MRPVDEVFNQRVQWIDGQLSASSAAEDIVVVNPASEQIVGHVAAEDTSDVDRAVQAAYRAFRLGVRPHWTNGWRC